MTRRYAEDTTVPVSRSKTELESILSKAGATGFGYITQGSRTAIQFELSGRRYLFRIDLPGLDDPEVVKNRAGGWRPASQRPNALAQIERQRWRALILIVKAKLESIAQEVETPEQAFLAQLMLPDGSTVGEWLAPQVEYVYETGRMPRLIPGADAQPLAMPAPGRRD